MKTKLMVVSLMALCSVALAAEYNNPDVGFKPHAIPSKEMKTADFGDHYKVESVVTTDRQIASEPQEDESDREPSSVVAKQKKVVEPAVEEPADAPKPWLYRMEGNSKH